MSVNGWLQFAIYSIILLAIVRPAGIYMARVIEGERTWLDPVLRPFERLIYKLCGVRADKEMNWREYTFAMLGFAAVTLVFTYAIERLQQFLPWNPQHLAAVGPDLAWNTAASFTTNTNWQFYTPESTMSYLTEMVGLATHNFWSAAAGIVVAIALIRGIKRTNSATIGNFWVDMTRTLLYILTPICIVYALLLVWQGVPQNLHAYTVVHTVEGSTQTIGQGPVASQEAIKMLGTNGGGFFNANSSHPYENPTPLSNFMQIVVDLPDWRGSHLYLGPNDRLARTRLGGIRRHVLPLRRRLRRVLLGRVASTSPDSWSRANAHRDRARRQHGGQGGAQRHRRERAVCHHHHRRQLRRGERHAR